MDITLVSYLTLLVVGTILTVVVGSVLTRSGQALLGEVYPEPRAAGLARLVSVGYHLIALGVLALISTIDVPVDGLVQALVTKLGVVLLVLGGAYAATLVVLGRLRDARVAADLDAQYVTGVTPRPYHPADHRAA